MLTFGEYHNAREDHDNLMEVLVFEQEILEWKKGHPGKDISKKEKSEVVKRAKRGENVFGGGFKKVEKAAKKRYGSEEAGKRVAAAIMWKKVKGKHMTKEDVDDMIWIIEDDLNVILDHATEEQNLLVEKKWIQKAVDPKHKGYCTPMTKPTCTPRRKALAMRFKKGDIHKANLEKDEK
jgi:hypothetical protein